MSKEDSRFLLDTSAQLQELNAQELSDLFFEISKTRNRTIGRSSKSLVSEMVANDDVSGLKDIVYQSMVLQVLDKVPRTIGQKVSTIQAFAHLLNPRTALRNITSNTTFRFQELFADYSSATFDFLISLKTGQRSVAVPSLRPSKVAKNVQSSKDAARSANFEIQSGVKLHEGLGKYELFRQETFPASQNKVLNAIERLLGYELKTPDQIAKGAVQISEVIKQLELQDVDVTGKSVEELFALADNETLQIAEQQALYNTFQDDGLIAGLMTSAKSTLNKVGISSGDFGLGDLLIKYTRVPGNLIQRSIDYTPLGALKLLKFIGTDGLTRTQQREIAKTLGRASTGTALAAVGFLLTQLGIIVSPPDEDKKEQKFYENQGIRGRQVNISAVERIINGEDPAIQDGDKLISFDFLETINVPLSLGHELAKSTEEQLPVADVLASLGDTFTEEVLDMPMMYIINSMVYESLKEDGQPLLVPIKQALPGFIPAPIRQASTAFDPFQRERDTFGESFQFNTPFRQELDPRLDTFGQPIRQDTGLGVFFNPGRTTTVEQFSFSPELERLGEREVDVFPSGAPVKKFSLNGEQFELTDQEQLDFMQQYGASLIDEYEQILTSDASDQEKINQLIEAQKDLKDRQKELFVFDKDPPFEAGTLVTDTLLDLHDETGNSKFLLLDDTFTKSGEEFTYPEGWEQEVIDGIEPLISDPVFNDLPLERQDKELTSAINSELSELKDDVLSGTAAGFLKTTSTLDAFDIHQIDGWEDFPTDSGVISDIIDWGVKPKDVDTFSKDKVVHTPTESQLDELATRTARALRTATADTAQKIINDVYNEWKTWVVQ
jgi:hypothetical protein